MAIDIERDLVLVMTASVDPKGMPAAATLADPQKRETDYANVLSYYLTHHPRIRRIVFAENSGWPLDRLRSAADSALAPYHPSQRAQVEFLSFQLNDFPRHFGKSYGELLLLDHVFAESGFVRSARYIAKITGRNYVLNITRLLERAPANLQFYGDLRDHGLYELIGSSNCGRHGESRFFVTTPQFYAHHFHGEYQNVDDSRGVMLENLIYRVVKQNEGTAGVTPRFPIEPQFSGIAGHLGKDYDSFKERTKRFVRGIMRRAAPWLRI